MIVPAILFLLSLLGLAASQSFPDAFLLAALCAVASFVFLLFGLRKRLQARQKPKDWIAVNGSNVMFWRDGLR